MLGNQELLGILSAPSETFCLSSLATCAEYACAEDSSGMGVGGRLSSYAAVCKHPSICGMARRFQEQLN